MNDVLKWNKKKWHWYKMTHFFPWWGLFINISFAKNKAYRCVRFLVVIVIIITWCSLQLCLVMMADCFQFNTTVVNSVTMFPCQFTLLWWHCLLFANRLTSQYLLWTWVSILVQGPHRSPEQTLSLPCNLLSS